MKRLYERYCQEKAKLLQLVAVLSWGKKLLLLDKTLSRERYNLSEIKYELIIQYTQLMTKLEKLYSTIQNLKELGLELGDDLLKQTKKLEQKIIKKEILPVISEKIKPIIGQIQRELVLVVDYVPNKPLSVRLSRKRNFSADMETIEILPDPQVEHNIGTIKRNATQKSSKKICESRFPRVCICLENENDVDYFVVLEVRATYLLLWTAFVSERSHETAKKMKEYQTWLKTNGDKEYTPDSMIMEIQKELKARSASKDAPVTPSTHGC